MKDLNLFSGAIVDADFSGHSKLGSGLLDSVHEVVLSHEPEKRGLRFEGQKSIPIGCEGIRFEEGFRADLIVEDCLVIELKAVEELARVHSRQLLTFLRLLGYRLGLLINFGAPVIKNGIRRIVNRL